MVKYIEPKELAEKIRNGNERILIIDVRDHDYLVNIFRVWHILILLG